MNSLKDEIEKKKKITAHILSSTFSSDMISLDYKAHLTISSILDTQVARPGQACRDR